MVFFWLCRPRGLVPPAAASVAECLERLCAEAEADMGKGDKPRPRFLTPKKTIRKKE